MRDNGVSDFPDPVGGGGFTIGGDVQNNPNFQSALEACQDLLPSGAVGGAAGGGSSSTDILEFAQCMRDHGVDFPDPSQGAVDVSGLDPNSPQFQSALETCASETGVSLGG